MKEHIQNVKHQFDPIFKEKPQVQWEFLKYEIRKFSKAFSKKKSKEKRENLTKNIYKTLNTSLILYLKRNLKPNRNFYNTKFESFL